MSSEPTKARRLNVSGPGERLWEGGYCSSCFPGIQLCKVFLTRHRTGDRNGICVPGCMLTPSPRAHNLGAHWGAATNCICRHEISSFWLKRSSACGATSVSLLCPCARVIPCKDGTSSNSLPHAVVSTLRHAHTKAKLYHTDTRHPLSLLHPWLQVNCLHTM